MSTEHENIRELLHAYLDGELDLAELKKQFANCAAR